MVSQTLVHVPDLVVMHLLNFYTKYQVLCNTTNYIAKKFKYSIFMRCFSSNWWLRCGSRYVVYASIISVERSLHFRSAQCSIAEHDLRSSSARSPPCISCEKTKIERCKLLCVAKVKTMRVENVFAVLPFRNTWHVGSVETLPTCQVFRNGFRTFLHMAPHVVLTPSVLLNKSSNADNNEDCLLQKREVFTPEVLDAPCC